ncbi:adenylate kinase [Afipia sp. GAS231]|uniref:adenylate kinase n=1 Tax=Afipia sp. GAS231 TaxID=1882747 RepID=UPI00087DAB6F|nr:adenylate kinase [Afipia sp. GAS231]SDO68242.1 Adenylate kinase [Afipia sp. GAS231]
MRLVLLGAPGSGKGTQAAQIVSRLKIAHLSTGEMLRAAVASKSPIGHVVESIMERGELVSDEIVVGIVAERLHGEDVKTGYVLDGFPRTVSQAVALDKVLADRGENLDAAVELKVVANDLIDRIMARASQAKAKGGKERADDNPETFALRLQAYEAQTAPLVDYYRSKSVLRSIDGMQAADAVAAAIRNAIGA